MADETIYSADTIAIAARELREAAGSEEATNASSEQPAKAIDHSQGFTADEAVASLSEEIRLLRERGFRDQQIADLLTGFDIPVSAEQVARNTPAPKLV